MDAKTIGRYKERFVERMGGYSEHALALLRVVTGLLFACHGAQKLFEVFGGFQGRPEASVPMLSLLGVAALIEIVAGVLIAVGLLTRPLALLASGEMAVAYFTVHVAKGFWPIQNQGELAVLYCFLFLFFVFRGGGPFSLDRTLIGQGGGWVSAARPAASTGASVTP